MYVMVSFVFFLVQEIFYLFWWFWHPCKQATPNIYVLDSFVVHNIINPCLHHLPFLSDKYMKRVLRGIWQANILQDLQEEIHRRVWFGAIHGGLVQCHDVDLLWCPYNGFPAALHQCWSFPYRDGLSHTVPDLCPGEAQGNLCCLTYRLGAQHKSYSSRTSKSCLILH